MMTTLRAHFDGKVIVPDEPVELPVNQPLKVLVHLAALECSDLRPEERRAALDRIVARAISGLNIADEALRRENLYEERT